jgi:thiamine biosynthesis lipoprotein
MRTRTIRLGALLVALTACDAGRTVTSYSGATMGTSYEVLVEEGRTPNDSARVGLLIERDLAAVTRVLSTYDPGSDISRFGRARTTEPVPVDPMLLDVLGSALVVSERSGGAFDPTVAPLVDAWGFGPTDGPPPDSARVVALRELVGYEALTVDPVAGTLSKARPSMSIDLSGVAKGYAAELIARELADSGFTSALVDVGGEVSALGTHRDGRPWRVALEGPGDASPRALGTIDLVDESVATSGDFRNYYEDRGVLYSHIIDPRTGFPLRFRGFSVSVVHSSGAMADAWATALTVLGPDEGFALAEQEGLAALFAWRTPEGVQTKATTAMAGRVTLAPTAS